MTPLGFAMRRQTHELLAGVDFEPVKYVKAEYNNPSE
jgi:hypothetical protein